MLINEKFRFLFIISLLYLRTKFSKTELFPALWGPITAICGKSTSTNVPADAHTSCILFTIGIRFSMPKPLVKVIFAVYNWFLFGKKLRSLALAIAHAYGKDCNNNSWWYLMNSATNFTEDVWILCTELDYASATELFAYIGIVLSHYDTCLW